MNLLNIRNIFLIGVVVLNIISLHVTNCCSSSGIEIEAPQTTTTTLNNGTGDIQDLYNKYQQPFYIKNLSWYCNIVGSNGYTQQWLRGDDAQGGKFGHAHEGLRLMDQSGWVAGNIAVVLRLFCTVTHFLLLYQINDYL